MFFLKRKKKVVLSSSSTGDRFDSKQFDKQQSLKQQLDENLKTITSSLGNSNDIIIREIKIGTNGILKAAIIYTDGLSDANAIQEFVMESLMIDLNDIPIGETIMNESEIMNTLKNYALTVGELKEVKDFNMLFTSLLSGNTILLIDGAELGFIIGNKNWQQRAVAEPTSQTVIRGPKEAFTENLRVNTALIRRIIKDTNLWMEQVELGTRTKTNIAIMYINGVAEESVIKEVHARLNEINIDGILESAYVEELIQDEPNTPFPTIYNTERPDSVAACLLEGRVAIFVDGSPYALIVPTLFVQFFHSPEDFYQRHWMATFVRLLRFFAFSISLLFPAMFIALVNFHREMLPTELLVSIASQKENTPFSTLTEVVVMEIAFELLREAGLRMPRVIGSAMSIVGAFVIGTAAVEAGLISAVMVIVVSLTAIASFVAPTYNIAISGRLLRFGFILLAGMFGLFGIVLGLILLILHLCHLKSFGIPYMYPFAPFHLVGQKDTVLRSPLQKMTHRSSYFSKNLVRQHAPSTKEKKSKGKT
ncbi:spore germination protein [Psychrobacillus sp. FSL K6-2843]|uniref:spore germination protein n=1 Tax=Psychrobacillus sp. FSL K6-2843 TaxID=2921549 RepID=UPI00315A60FA